MQARIMGPWTIGGCLVTRATGGYEACILKARDGRPMKFSLRQDTGLSADQLFDAISDFARMERMLVRRGAAVRRVDPAHEPGAGMAWDMAFDLRGKRRELRLDVTQFDRPEEIVILGQSEPLDVSI